MKTILFSVCAVLVHVNAQSSCGCRPPPCRPPPCRPPPSRPPPCQPPTPVRPCSCPAPTVVECPSYEIQPCRPSPFVSPILTPTVEYVSPTYEVVSAAVALPSCNCPTVPSLPVSAQVLPAIQSPPFFNGLGCLSSCLGGCVGGLDLSPLGMINPFLPAASPVSALAPTVSSLYPPINPCNCGCKYLKKIPIPPPFL